MDIVDFHTVHPYPHDNSSVDLLPLFTGHSVATRPLLNNRGESIQSNAQYFISINCLNYSLFSTGQTPDMYPRMRKNGKMMN